VDELSREQLERLEALVARHGDLPDSLLPVLHDVQREFGFIPPAAVPRIASALNLSRADVHGVITFFHDFRVRQPRTRFRLQFCRAEACQAVGAARLERHARDSLGIDGNGESADGLFSVDGVYCLGNCACGPSLRVGDEIFGRVDAARLDALCAGMREKTTVSE
jgi:formate dehydrogenase subunit gamma